MRTRSASATAARSPAVHAACTASSACRGSSCVKRPIAAIARGSPRRAGEEYTMSMTDPIADLLTRIRNAQRAGKPDVSAPASKVKVALVKVLKDEGYVADYAVKKDGGKSRLDVQLK